MRQRTIIDDFLDALKGATIEFVEAHIVDHIPQQPRARRVTTKPPKIKTPKTPKPAKRERAEPTAYEILEVSPNASPETITAAFRSLAKRFHPDGKAGAEAKRCEMRMILLNLAYERLDPARRADYDAKLKREAR